MTKQSRCDKIRRITVKRIIKSFVAFHVPDVTELAPYPSKTPVFKKLAKTICHFTGIIISKMTAFKENCLHVLSFGVQNIGN